MNSSSDLVILKNLEILGLTPNQSKIIVTISKIGSADASTIVLKSGVPRGKIYSILSELVDLDLIERDKTNDRVYNFRGAHHVATKLKIEKLKEQEKIRNAADESERLLKTFEEESESKPTQDIWIYEGLSETISSLETAIINSKESMYGSFKKEILENVTGYLEQAQNKGVKVNLFIEENEIPEILLKNSKILDSCITFNFSKVQNQIGVLIKTLLNDHNKSLGESLSSLEDFYISFPNFLLIDQKQAFIILKPVKENIDYLAINFGNPEIIRTQSLLIKWVWNLIKSIQIKKG